MSACYAIPRFITVFGMLHPQQLMLFALTAMIRYQGVSCNEAKRSLVFQVHFDVEYQLN